MPKCGKPKADGTPCQGNAMVGKDHCQHHKPEAKPTPMIDVMTDPVADLMAEIQRLRREGDDLAARLTRMEDERDQIIKETSDQLVRERHPLSAEDLQKVQTAAQLDFARRRAKKQQQLEIFNRQLRQENRLSYTPTRTLMIPFGGIEWWFTAGAPSKYPKCVIDQFEEKCWKLDEREKAKARLSIDTEDTGREFGMEYGQMQRVLDASK